MTLLSNTRIGSQVPRISSHPDYSLSVPGHAAIELAQHAGQTLDSWQRYVLYRGLGQNDAGKWTSREVACIAPRQNGKGAIVEARQLAGLFVYKERLQVYTATRFQTAESQLRRIVGLCKGDPELDKQCRYWNSNTKKGIETRDGSTLLFLARTKDSLRGLTIDCLYVDEAYGLTDDEKAALGYTVSAVPNHQIWYFSTPPLSAAESQPLYKLRQRALDNDPRLAYFDWGAEEGADLDDEGVYYQTNPALGIRIELDTVLSERASYPDEDFARERLGIWPSLASQHVIDPAQWAKLADKTSKRENLPFAAAVDVSPDRTSYLAVAFRRPDGRMHVELAAANPGTGWVTDAIMALKAKSECVAIALDNLGPGRNLLQELEKAGLARSDDPERPKPGDLVVPTGGDAIAACLALVDGISSDAIRHRDQPKLNVAVGSAKTKDSGIWQRNTPNGSALMAASLAMWAFRTRVDLVQADNQPSILWL